MTKYLKIIICTACLAFICQTSTVNATSDACVQLADNTSLFQEPLTDNALAGAPSEMLTAAFNCLKIGIKEGTFPEPKKMVLPTGIGFAPGEKANTQKLPVLSAAEMRQQLPQIPGIINSP